MKHYPVIVAGIKAAASVELFWNYATVSIKISHRKGQIVNYEIDETVIPEGITNVWMDNYPTYTAIRFEVQTKNFRNAKHAILDCARCIGEITKSINFDVSQKLVAKELLIALLS